MSALDPIRRLREIVAEADNHALLADGPVTPDAALLDLCAEALHLFARARETLAAREAIHWPPESLYSDDSLMAGPRAEQRRLSEEHERLIKQAKPILSKIRKLHCATPAGIYAKALVVRSSRTGAPLLAMSLAEDHLIACQELRASLWPASEDGGAA
jgi:hypothetical protein